VSGQRRAVTFEVDENGCHICTSHAIGTHGYPKLWKNGQSHNLHRVLFEELHGDLAPGLLVRHKCDVRACINLDHLIEGTRQDNTNDITERGRHNPPLGERCGTAKLDTAAVKAIRFSAESQYKLADKYGVNQSTISRIRSQKRWAHLFSTS
jgi:hypothetical protein